MAPGVLRQFWVGFILTAGLIGTGLHLWWKPHLDKLPPRLSFPLSTEEYPSGYTRGIADHYLYLFGIFGMADRIRDSDVICIGTSHFEFGFSASELAKRLSSFYGRPIKAYNLGLGFADMALQAECLERLGIRKKTIVMDSFAPMGEVVSDWGTKVKRSDILGAYIQVCEIWADLVRDWFTDPFLPRVVFQKGDFHVERFLSFITTRRWDNGDVEEIYAPQSGIVYERGVPPPSSQQLPLGAGTGRFGMLSDIGIRYPEAFRKVTESNSLNVILTLWPFEGYKPEFAEKMSVETGHPLVLVPPEGLQFRDPDHLNAPSRDIATNRLFDLSEAQGIDFLDPKKKAGNKP